MKNEHTEELALAIEHMKVHQLTTLQAKTESARHTAVTMIRHGIARNKELIQEFNELQTYVLNNPGHESFDRIGELLRKHEAWAEQFADELSCSLGIDPRKTDEPMAPLVFLKAKE
ncbi:hypothetical protein pEaSNUABM8_00154 [Erwinia phage pEa_SNUABM_8]|nr:hypothetical protein pEaSNUABM8_00154 [Erwinia phage pEa_SNUABM_8]QVW54906.1 hypothetical protein pEaSNUABM4_00153 [Erwinia phage pEa_SNUABM_4]